MPDDRLEELARKLDEVVRRLERLENALEMAKRYLTSLIEAGGSLLEALQRPLKIKVKTGEEEEAEEEAGEEAEE